MHTRIRLPSELIDELEHPTVTAAAILAAADTPVEDLNLEVEALHLPAVELTDIDCPEGFAGTGARAIPDGNPAPKAAPTTLSGTTHTTIRIPARLLAIYKTKAAKLGMGYQTLIIRTLNNAAPGL
jgi:hypothetical protein